MSTLEELRSEAASAVTSTLAELVISRGLDLGRTKIKTLNFARVEF